MCGVCACVYFSQACVFAGVGQGILGNALQGYNATLLAYGQTGSGKSYSMMGFGANKGLVPNLCHSLFTYITANQDRCQCQVYLPVFLPACLLVYLPTCPSTCLPACLSTWHLFNLIMCVHWYCIMCMFPLTIIIIKNLYITITHWSVCRLSPGFLQHVGNL